MGNLTYYPRQNGQHSQRLAIVDRFMNRKRAKLEIAGAFVFIGLVSSLSIIAAAGNSKDGSINRTDSVSESSNLQVEVNSSSDNPTVKTVIPESNESVNANGSSEASDVHTSLTVNGQTVPVPENGSTQQTIVNNDGGNTSVDVTSTQSGNGTNSSSSSFDLNVSSNNSSEVNIRQKETP